MRPLLRPVGSLPASVYWVRRLALLAVVLLLAWLVISLAIPDGPKEGVAAGGDKTTSASTTAARSTVTPGTTRSAGPGSTPAPRVTSTGAVKGSASSKPATPSVPPAKKPTAPATSPATPARPTACGQGSLDTSVEAAKNPSPVGQPVAIRVTIRNAASAACQLTVDPTSLRIQITSGNDLIWDTRHCPSVVPKGPLTLEPKKSRTLTFTWPGTRSREGCPSGQPNAQPGYYAAEVTVAGTSARDRFQLT
ncbi:hypothetical protein [Actinopolymorpha alba]|uniref:hypothetical protein n=1 Tax=Actinopolymorpha alba TaxID=533267 RepID=UPI0003617A5B|nr:hypothetical protein [Actinopolymorpha alba]